MNLYIYLSICLAIYLYLLNHIHAYIDTLVCQCISVDTPQDCKAKFVSHRGLGSTTGRWRDQNPPNYAGGSWQEEPEGVFTWEAEDPLLVHIIPPLSPLLLWGFSLSKPFAAQRQWVVLSHALNLYLPRSLSLSLFFLSPSLRRKPLQVASQVAAQGVCIVVQCSA